MKRRVSLLIAIAMFSSLTSKASAQGAEPHGWLGTETLSTQYGEFRFENGIRPAIRRSGCSTWSCATGRSKSTSPT
jgi:hypothetical protein